MNFFESQDIARRNTKLLLFLFFLAVVSLVALTNLLLFVLVNSQDTATIATGNYRYSWELFITVSVGVVVLITLASFFRLLSLRKGGSAIAEMLNGELLVDAGNDLNKQKLLNVVQEMAIASGTPVPPVYLIRDSAINAFAAGYSPGDAVIGVTYGAMESLNREELQGVIAHEFSHILNGDMRLNIKLMGVLYGILLIALIGRIIMQPSAAASRDRSHAAIIAVGIGLMIIGYLGQFFGNAIKAAVSRQREYLADASAVQFTRNPNGIAGALKRIGGYKDGSVLQHPESHEMSHSFFAEGVEFFALSSMMATHPPLDERISRIEPNWNGEYLETIEQPSGSSSMDETGAMGFASGGVSPTATTPIDTDAAIEHIGNPDESQLQVAQALLASIPSVFTKAAAEPYTGRALIYLLMLDSDAEVRTTQLNHLKEEADLGVYDELTKLILQEAKLTDSMRLPLIELTLPSLRQLSYEQYKLFQSNLDALIRADGRIGLSEWAIQKLVTKHLGEAFEGHRIETRHDQLKSVQSHSAVLLSMLAYADRHAEVSPETAFADGATELEQDLSLVERKSLSFGKLNTALDELAALHPLRKPKLLKACLKIVAADNKITVTEAELMRSIADSLECPMPPLTGVVSD